MLGTLLAFIVTIIVIVAIHEYGHYLAMRLFGVRVLRFSIGFGPRLLGWRNREGTEFVISGVPLGGYVKPLDRREAEVPPEQAHEEFSGKPVWQRIITYAAGPLANLVLALVLYWGVMLGGQTVVAPVLGDLSPDTPAEQAGLESGDRLLSVGGREVRGWSEVASALMHHAGAAGTVDVTVRSEGGDTETLALPLAAWSRDPEQSPFKVLGLNPASPRAIVGEVLPDSPAARAGLRPGDRVIAVDDTPVSDWGGWVEAVRAHPGQALALEVIRDGHERSLTLTPEPVQANGETIGRVGVMAGDVERIEYSAMSAIPAAAKKLVDQTAMILQAIGRMITGELSVKTLAGPLTIAQAAGETASVGLTSFALFLAFFSVSLGIINLLPIPLLDGGWIALGLIEWVRGRELPERFLLMAQSIGLSLVLGLMALAIYNDLIRHFG